MDQKKRSARNSRSVRSVLEKRGGESGYNSEYYTVRVYHSLSDYYKLVSAVLFTVFCVYCISSLWSIFMYILVSIFRLG